MLRDGSSRPWARNVSAARSAGVSARQLAVAGGFHQLAVEAFVQPRHRAAVRQALLASDQPGGAQLLQLDRQLAGRAFAQPPHGFQFEDDAHVVQLLEVVEVERRDLPAAAKRHGDKALALQLVQRLAHRRTADRHALGDFAFAETVAGQQAELEDVLLQLPVDGIGQAGRCAALGHGLSPTGWR